MKSALIWKTIEKKLSLSSSVHRVECALRNTGTTVVISNGYCTCYSFSLAVGGRCSWKSDWCIRSDRAWGGSRIDLLVGKARRWKTEKSTTTATTTSTAIYNERIHALAKQSNVRSAGKAEDMLRGMLERYRSSGDEAEKPDIASFTSAIDAWACSGDEMAPVKAENILKLMEEFYTTTGPNQSVQPDIINAYNAFLNVLAKAGNAQSATRAEQLLTDIETRFDMGEYHWKPNAYTYTTVINAWGKLGAAERAERILSHMCDRYSNNRAREGTHDWLVRPNTITFNAAIKAWVCSGDTLAPLRAEQILKRMEELGLELGYTDMAPDVYSYNTVIDAWGKSRKRQAASRAEQILYDMQRRYEEGKSTVKPDTVTYNTVIDALAKSGEPDAAERSELILCDMLERFNNGEVGIVPSCITFNSVLAAWAACSAKDTNAVYRAEQLLGLMEEMHTLGNEVMQPNLKTYNTVLSAWAKSNHRTSVSRASQIIDDMERISKTDGKRHLKPNTVTFNTLLHLLAKSNEPDAAERAERILHGMMERYNNNGDYDVMPDTISFTSVVDAWVRSKQKNAPLRAEKLLREMEDLYESGRNLHVQPNLFTYNSTINAWAKSGVLGAPSRAAHILASMCKLYEEGKNARVKPDVWTYTSVINACANTKHKKEHREALTIALRTFDQLKSQKDIIPNSFIFCNILYACKNLIPKDSETYRISLAKEFFELCSKAGYVNDYVLRI